MYALHATYKRYPNSNYEVSALGEVRHIRNLKVLIPGLHRKGYHQVIIYVAGKRCKRFIHRMVAECYLKHSPNQEIVDHKDCNKLNNHFRNLEYVTVKENTKRAYAAGLIDMAKVRSHKQKSPKN